MSRRNAAVKRPILPDPQFNSRLATMMVARLMQHGKQSTAQRIRSDAFGLINDRTGGDPLELFETAVKNATPLVEVRARRVALPGLPVAADRRVPALPELPPRPGSITGGGRGRRRPRGLLLPVRVARRRRAPRPRLRPRVGRVLV